MSKFKHTVEIETDSEADETARVILKHSQSGVSAKVIKTEEIKPTLLPLKVGDRLRHVKWGCTCTVIHKGKVAWALEWDAYDGQPEGRITGCCEEDISDAMERIP